MKEIVTSFPENSRKVSWRARYFRRVGSEGRGTGEEFLCGPDDHLAPRFPGMCENATGVTSDSVRATGSAERV